VRDYNESQCYVQHLVAEHRRLHRMLRSARAAMVASAAPDHDATCADIVRVLRQVRTELEHHFAQEESGGCLDEAASRVPGLSGEAKRIELEHPRLLENADRLIAQAMDCDQSLVNRLSLERGFDELCRQLDAHEGAENAVLRKGFGVNVNGNESCEEMMTFDL
jgi:hypothetical protein